MTRWNYKGLACEINQTESGYLYSVADVGLITRKPNLIIYGGSPTGCTKSDVEGKIDIWLKENNIILTNQCNHLLDSYKKGHCAFKDVCEDTCVIHSNSDELEELRKECDELEEEFESNKKAVSKIVEILEDYDII